MFWNVPPDVLPGSATVVPRIAGKAGWWRKIFFVNQQNADKKSPTPMCHCSMIMIVQSVVYCFLYLALSNQSSENITYLKIIHIFFRNYHVTMASEGTQVV